MNTQISKHNKNESKFFSSLHFNKSIHLSLNGMIKFTWNFCPSLGHLFWSFFQDLRGTQQWPNDALCMKHRAHTSSVMDGQTGRGRRFRPQSKPGPRSSALDVQRRPRSRSGTEPSTGTGKVEGGRLVTQLIFL